MRVDKYLKNARIIKRRSISKDIINFKKVSINNKVAKPASLVKVNDIIDLDLGNKNITIKVLALYEKPTKEQSMNMYEIISEKTTCSNNLL